MPSQETSSEKSLQLDIEVLKQFRIIFRSVRRHFQSIEQACGVSGSQLWALAKIAAESNLTVTQLARALAIHQSTASNLVEKLVDKNLVAKVKGENDLRTTCLKLTAEGQKIIGRAPGPLQGLLPDALGHMPYNRLRDMHRLLSELMRIMDSIEAEAGTIPLSDP